MQNHHFERKIENILTLRNMINFLIVCLKTNKNTFIDLRILKNPDSFFVNVYIFFLNTESKLCSFIMYKNPLENIIYIL